MTTEPAAPATTSTTPDVLGMQIAHRVMLRDLDRTTGVAMAMADGGQKDEEHANDEGGDDEGNDDGDGGGGGDH